MIRKANLIFNQDNENFTYTLYTKDEKGNVLKEEEKTTDVTELVKLKNKIHIKPNKKNNNKEDKKSDELEKKTDALLFFKDVVCNVETIYSFMTSLRIKGCCLPISINICIKYFDPTKIEYNLNGKKTEFSNIQKFLSDEKFDLLKQLESIYKEKANLRFLY